MGWLPTQMTSPFRSIAALALVGALVAGAACTSDDANASEESTTTVEAATTTVAEAGRRSAGCALARTPPTDIITTETLKVDGVTRTYRLAVPPDPTTPAPLVMVLHGSVATAADIEVVSELSMLGPIGGFLTVIPEGDPVDGWELSPHGADTAFLTALLDRLEAAHCVDLDRVHGIGMSVGAWKIASLACANAGRFAALSLVTVEVYPGECEPMPVIAFHGTADVVVPYGEGGDDVTGIVEFNASLPGARSNIAAWANSAGCDPEPSEERIEPDVFVTTYGACERGTVVLHTIEGGGHTWPGSPRDDAFGQKTTRTISATERSLAFFDANPRPAA